MIKQEAAAHTAIQDFDAALPHGGVLTVEIGADLTSPEFLTWSSDFADELRRREASTL